MNSTKLVIQQNNELREELNEENEAYYVEMLVYMRSRSWFKDERKLEEVLMEVLQDLIKAQEEGISAEAYFGNNPQASANNILSNVDKCWTDGLKLLLLILGISTMFSILDNVVSLGTSLDLSSILFRTTYLYLSVMIVMKIIQNDSYNRKWSRLKLGLYIIGFLSILTAGPVIEATILPRLLIFAFPLSFSFSFYFCVSVLLSWKFIKLSAEEKKLWFMMLLFVWGALLFGIVNYL